MPPLRLSGGAVVLAPVVPMLMLSLTSGSGGGGGGRARIHGKGGIVRRMCGVLRGERRLGWV